MSSSKFQIKIKQPDKSYNWVHFSYVPSSLKLQFDKWVNGRGWLTNQWLNRWAADEFGLGRIDKPEDLQALRIAIKDKYKKLYPEIFIASDTDFQGWSRVWVADRMKQELKGVGKEYVEPEC
jgi:hypothetical protein